MGSLIWIFFLSTLFFSVNNNYNDEEISLIYIQSMQISILKNVEFIL